MYKICFLLDDFKFILDLHGANDPGLDYRERTIYSFNLDLMNLKVKCQSREKEVISSTFKG